MSYQIICLPEGQHQESPLFIEGVILAANLATKPLDPESWLKEIFGDDAESMKDLVVEQINLQYNQLKRNEYSVLNLVEGKQQTESLADLAEGFMSLWPQIEAQWFEIQVGDGTLRMLQALLTTMMLAIDEPQTQLQMKEAGVEQPPCLAGMVEQIDLMINEVAHAADAAQMGLQSQSVNPYKDVGRNDACPCGSGNKFKQCCGK